MLNERKVYLFRRRCEERNVFGRISRFSNLCQFNRQFEVTATLTRTTVQASFWQVVAPNHCCETWKSPEGVVRRSDWNHRCWTQGWTLFEWNIWKKKWLFAYHPVYLDTYEFHFSGLAGQFVWTRRTIFLEITPLFGQQMNWHFSLYLVFEQAILFEIIRPIRFILYLNERAIFLEIIPLFGQQIKLHYFSHQTVSDYAHLLIIRYFVSANRLELFSHRWKFMCYSLAGLTLLTSAVRGGNRVTFRLQLLRS